LAFWNKGLPIHDQIQLISKPAVYLSEKIKQLLFVFIDLNIESNLLQSFSLLLQIRAIALGYSIILL